MFLMTKTSKLLNRIESGFIEPIYTLVQAPFDSGDGEKVVNFPRLHDWCWQFRSMPITAWATPQIPCVPMRILVPCLSADPTSLRASLPAAPARWVPGWKTGSWFEPYINIKTGKHKTPTLRKGKDVNQLKMAFALSHPFVHNNRFLEVETWKMPGRNRAQFGSFLLGGICLMACALGTLDSIFVMTMAIIARMCSLGRGSSHLKILKWLCYHIVMSGEILWLICKSM